MLNVDRGLINLNVENLQKGFFQFNLKEQRFGDVYAVAISRRRQEGCSFYR